MPKEDAATEKIKESGKEEDEKEKKSRVDKNVKIMKKDSLDSSEDEKVPEKKESKKEEGPTPTRTKSNQRWMKLRTTVQLSGAISSTIQKSKPALKREDSFLKRFSTRQIPDTQETIDTGDDTDVSNGPQDQDEVNRRRLRRRRQSSRFVVNPDENFYFCWLMVVTGCVLYNLWAMIVRQSFPELQNLLSRFWFAIDGITDIIFLCDIFVQFRTGYLEQGLMVYDWKKLSGHYMKSRDFLLDIFALTPLDLLQLFVGVYPILRFPRFLKTYRVYDYYYMVESRTVYPNLWRVVNLVHILLILAHWFGCFYYLLSEAEGFKGDWVYPYQQGDYATLTRKYLGSLYWSTLTLTTIGDLPTPETNSEYIFTIVSYLIGVFIFATIVGQVGNVITNRNANRLEFERLLDGAKTYMRHHKVPGGMKRRVLRWYDYSWSRGRIQGGGDINTALGLLPDKLKTELALHVNLSVLKKVTIFQECQPEFLHDLVLKMKAYIFTPGDLICRKGEVAREMFIIADGILDVISDTGRVLTTMKAGDFFGEIGILNLDGLNKRTADVRSVGYSELFSLSREDVLAAMKDYPEAEEILQTLGRKRLMEARNASKMKKTGKDQASSIESDTAGKRIVEKLRSDVKGLKNALRRSRRGARSKDKQSILMRMSHVQSSDEYDEPMHSPIGPGLPLLQRLKLLKEKQDKEKLQTSSQMRKDSQEHEVIGAGLPLMHRLKLLKQKEDKEDKEKKETSSPNDNKGVTTTATVHTQHSGVRFEDGKNLSTKLSQTNYSETSPDFELKEKPETAKKKESGNLFRDALKKLQPKPSNDSSDSKTSSSRTSKSDDLEVPNGTGIKLSITKAESVKGKDSWGLLKKSSVKPTPKPKKACYLSKSDTILEKKSEADKKERRSRSASPSSGKGRRSLRIAVENIIKERRRTKSLGQAPKRPFEEVIDVNAWEFSESAFSQFDRKDADLGTLKKYDSVDDLSPEYSGLPFVKKLKILNEKQVTGGNTVPRSASLDITDRMVDDIGLFRSQSEASAIQTRRLSRFTLEMSERRRRSNSHRRRENQFFSDYIQRSDTIIERPYDFDGLPHSPESNETLERRHLKSILKRLSAEENEENVGRKINDEEMRNLLRAQTIEGYAARHSKLTKSVTFHRQTLPSPPSSPSRTETNLPFCQTEGEIPYQQSPHWKSQENEIFRGVVTGIKQVMQGYLDDIELRFQSKYEYLEMEVMKRDELIALLENKLQHGDSPLSEELSPEPESSQDAAFMRDDSLETVLGNSHPLDELNERDDDYEGAAACGGIDNYLDNVPRNPFPFQYNPPVQRSSFFRRHSEQEQFELSNFSRSYAKSQSYLRRVRSEEARKREFVSLDMDDSDSSEAHNKDWEVEMLVEELDKRNSSYAQESLRKIENEVKTLQKVVESTDFETLSPGDLRILEEVIYDSDRRIASISHSNSLNLGIDLGRGRRRNYGSRERQAFSLDYYDYEKRCYELKRDQYYQFGLHPSGQSLPPFSPTSVSSCEGLPAESESNDSVFEEEDANIDDDKNIDDQFSAENKDVKDLSRSDDLLESKPSSSTAAENSQLFSQADPIPSTSSSTVDQSIPPLRRPGEDIGSMPSDSSASPTSPQEEVGERVLSFEKSLK